MGIISEIKCSKCDRMYSGLRSRCPYCGTRRIGRGKYSDETDNSKGKMLIAVLIMGVLVVATGVLLFTTEAPEPDDSMLGDELEESLEESPLDDNEGIFALDGANLVVPPEDDIEPPEEEDTPLTVEVQSVTVRHGRNNLPGHPNAPEFSLKLNETSITLNVSVEPVGVLEIPQWTTSNMNVFEVTPTTPEADEATVRAISKGTATLTVAVGEVSQDVIVRIT